MFWKNNIPKKWKNEGRPTKSLIASVLLVIQFQKPTFGSYIHNKLIYWDIYIKRNAPLSFKISRYGENFYIWYHCYLWHSFYRNIHGLIHAILYPNDLFLCHILYFETLYQRVLFIWYLFYVHHFFLKSSKYRFQSARSCF